MQGEQRTLKCKGNGQSVKALTSQYTTLFSTTSLSVMITDDCNLRFISPGPHPVSP